MLPQSKPRLSCGSVLSIKMTSSPTKHVPHLPPSTLITSSHQLNSPRRTPGLRKLQSAHALSSHYAAAANNPSLISQQRQQQQRSTSTAQNSTLSQIPQIPPLPQIPALPLSHSHNRTRSNSDAIVPTSSNGAFASKKYMVAKKTIASPSPKEELDSLVRQGPRGDLPASLVRLRHLILVDGLDSDSDGMVSFPLR